MIAFTESAASLLSVVDKWTFVRHLTPRQGTSKIFAVQHEAKCGLGDASQRSLHNAPIFRLLLKVAVNGTHQCDFLNFWGSLGSQH